jgi:hypothetical protein
VALDSETLAVLQKAVLKNQSLESTGMEITKEVSETYQALLEEYDNAPKGSMAWIIEDVEWGKWDAFEANNEKWYGPLFGDKPIGEQLAERRAEVKRLQSKKPDDA